MAENAGIELLVNVDYLLNQVNNAIGKINADSGLKKLKLGVDTSSIDSAIKNLKTELASLSGKSKIPKVLLGLSRADGQITLEEFDKFKKAQEAAANPVGMSAVRVEFDSVQNSIMKAVEAVRAFKTEYESISSVTFGGNVSSPNTITADTKTTIGDNAQKAAEQFTEALKRQIQEQKNLAYSENATSQATKNQTDDIRDQTKAIKENIEASKIRNTVTAGGDIYSAITYGSSSENTTVKAKNGEFTSKTTVKNLEQQRKEIEKNEVAAIKLKSALDDVRASYSSQNVPKPITDTAHLETLGSKYSEVNAEIEKIGKSTGKVSETTKANVDSMIKDLKRYVTEFRNAEYVGNQLRDRTVEVVGAQEANNLETFISKIKNVKVLTPEIKTEIDTLRDSIKNVTNKDDIVAFLNQFDIFKSKITALTSQAQSADKAMDEIQRGITTLNGISNNSTLYKNKGVEEIKVLLGGVNELKSSYQTLMESLKNDNSAENVSKIKEQIAELGSKTKEAAAEADRLAKSVRNVGYDEKIVGRLQRLQSSIEVFKNANSGGLDKINPNTGLTFGTELDAILAKIPEAQVKGESLTKSLEDGFKSVNIQMEAVGATGKTVLQELFEKGSKFIKWTAMTLVITKSRMYFKQLFTTVYDLDTELIDLKKTFNGTEEELNDFYFEANRLAKQMGVTTAEIIKQGSAWSRLNYSSNEAMKKMAEMSAMFAAISPDMNTEQAQKGLVSIMKAFKIDPDNVLDEILSKVNIVGNTAATSNGEIVEMLEKSSSAMKEANNTLEETIALETAAVEITQDASSVGNAFKTVSMRIRGYDEETEEYIGNVEELSGKIADLTKTASKPGGISLFTDANKTTYKSTYQLLKDISEIYNDLTDKQQAGLLEALSGKRQGQIVAATIKNFGAAEKALQDMANSAGSAEEELKTYQESAEFAANEFKETFTALAQNAVDRGDLKEFIKFGTSMLEIVNGIVERVGAIPALISAIVGVISAKNISNGGIFGLEFNEKTGKNGLTAFGSQVGKGWFDSIKSNIADIKAQKIELQQAIKAVNEYHAAFRNGTMTTEQFNSTLNHSNPVVRQYVQNIKEGKNETEAYKKASGSLNTELQEVSINAKAAGIGAKAAAVGVKALNIAVDAFISMGVSIAIQTIVSALDEAVHSYENNIEKLNEINSTIQSLEGSYDSLNSQLEESKKKLLELKEIPNPTLFDQAEIDRLEKANQLLETQIKLKQIEIEEAKQAAIEQAKRTREDTNIFGTFKNNFVDLFTDKDMDIYERIVKLGSLPFMGGLTTWESVAQNVGNLFEGNLDFQQNQKLDDAKKALEEYKKVKQEFEEINKSDASAEEIQKVNDNLKFKEDALKDSIVKIKGYYSQLQKELNALETSPEGNEKRIEELKQIIPEIEKIIFYQRTVGDILDIYDDVEFSNVTSQLEELAKKGELTAKKFKALTDADIEGIEALRKALEDAGFNDVDEIIRAIISRVEKANDETDKYGDTVYDLAETFDKLYDAIDNVLDKQKQLAEAFKKTQLGASLTAEEIYELIKAMPALAKYVQNTADGFTILPEGFKAVSEENKSAVREQVQKEIETIRNNIDLLKKKESFEQKFKQTNQSVAGPILPSADLSVPDFKEYAEVAKQCQNITESVGELEEAEKSLKIFQDLLNESFDETKMAIEGINEAFNNAKSEISTYNSNIKTIDSAIEKLKSGALLTYEEMNSIVQISSVLQDSFEEPKTGYYDIAIESLKELREESYKTRNDFINDRIAEVNADIEAAKEAKKAYEDKIKSLSAAGIGAAAANAAYIASLEGNIDNINEHLDALYETIEKLQGLQGNIAPEDDKDSDIVEQLQNEIDKYTTILSAVELVRDKYSEAIDKEIGALEDSKDALKDANDERQRELDLIEARNNLENAKKRKVWVYTEDGGFQQVQDEGAAKKAEEEYKEAIANIQEAEIDKQIEVLEGQKEALEENTEALTKLEQNIQDAMTIEQAKALLGLSEDADLLNLSEEEKQKIISDLVNALNQKDIVDNKDKTDSNGNSTYTPITTDDILKSLGATITADDLKGEFLTDFKKGIYDSAIKAFTDSLEEYKNNAASSSVINNTNGGTVVSPTINIYDASDPDKIAKVVIDEMKNLFTQVGNSIK